MSLRNVIQNAIKGPLAFVARELGDQLSVARGTQVRQRDGSTRDTWAGIANLIHVRGTVEEVDAVRAQQVFGTNTVATGVASIQTTVNVQQDDRIVVESGAFTGRHFNVDVRRFDQMTNTWTLGVREVAAVAVTGL